MVIGINLGSQAAVVASADGAILRNEDGGVRTSSIVAFTAAERKLGEAAGGAQAKDRVASVPRLGLLKHSALADAAVARHWPFPRSEHASGLSQLAVPGFGDQSGVALLGALLGKLRSTSGAAAGSPVALSLPPCAAAGASPEEAEASRRFAKAALADAAAVGGWGGVVEH